MKGNVKRKSFEELMVGIENPGEVEEVCADEITDIKTQMDCSDEEAEIRAQVFLNGYKMAENLHKKSINNISFQLNRRFKEGGQAGELIQLYNERIGCFLDDLIC